MKLGIVSSHARMSMKRRGIPPQALETLFAYGLVAHAPHGSRVVYFGSVGKAALSKSAPPSQIDRWADMYAVLDPQNEVITVGYRTNRIRRAISVVCAGKSSIYAACGAVVSPSMRPV